MIDVKFGDRVTIVSRSLEGGLARALVNANIGARAGKFFDTTYVTLAELEALEEGVWWCRGWEGPAVDALKVAEALR